MGTDTVLSASAALWQSGVVRVMFHALTRMPRNKPRKYWPTSFDSHLAFPAVCSWHSGHG